MPTEYQDYSRKKGPPPEWGETYFCYCQFSDLDIDGVSFDGLMHYCTLERSKFYWGLFNTAAFLHVRFIDCVFPGSSFRGCHFVACEFLRCRFTLDNLGGAAVIDDCTLTECRFENCSFERSSQEDSPLLTPKTRLYGCTLEGCTGIP